MKLDPEHQIIAAALDQAAFAEANERVVAARIEFPHEGCVTAVREGKIRRLIINLPPRHLKSLMASIAFPAWCLGHDPSAQILSVSYAQDLADKLARDCRGIMMSPCLVVPNASQCPPVHSSGP
jgi:hypothetical protein